METYSGSSIDHQRSSSLFATASTLVQIWDETKSAPISNVTFPTSSETIYSVRFNQSETSILASVGSDRTFTLYDIRTGKAERQVVMQMRANALSWSPTFPTSILLASEDHNLCGDELRVVANRNRVRFWRLGSHSTNVADGTRARSRSISYKTDAKVWTDYLPRIVELNIVNRRVSSTLFTNDACFVLSGSDDGNVRIWKGKASEKLGTVTAREHAAIEYRSSLVDWWTKKKRHLPKPPSATLETISEKDTPPNTPIRPGQRVTVQFDSASGKAPTLQIRFSALDMPSPVEIAESIKYGRDQPGIAHSRKSSYYANSVMTRQTEPPLSSPSVGLPPQNFADASPTRIKHTSDPLAWRSSISTTSHEPIPIPQTSEDHSSIHASASKPALSPKPAPRASLVLNAIPIDPFTDEDAEPGIALPTVLDSAEHVHQMGLALAPPDNWIAEDRFMPRPDSRESLSIYSISPTGEKPEDAVQNHLEELEASGGSQSRSGISIPPSELPWLQQDAPISGDPHGRGKNFDTSSMFLRPESEELKIEESGAGRRF
ncbi:hypothetical protein D9757_010884 [Collybiopsis confluens]|uniref:Uncharacterized protein n=1 Tax=Collybiopsis confluens TaxID=2823264 RepID=A0A8H5M2D9_9AGAR|nr:hypothetical protein D9757_010884 [Collybiopsis confluens]